ncbi:MAG TPA: NAD(P)/FAD-dependent oxidoreductase [Acidimicrobiales bacterium]|nr:NAD(P)/FAD-dependent oxidoreductase [Acidimicrobiales bacterium]
MSIPQRQQEGRRPRVVVVGAGFGGLQVARGLARDDVDVTIVDRHNFHTFQPLLYQVATAGLDAESIAYPVRGLAHRNRSLDLRVGTVVGGDLTSRLIRLADGGTLDYDYLVLAAGAVTADFGIPGVAEHGFPLKTLADSVRLRSHLLSEFEWADAHLDEAVRSAMTIVVVGGGPTGVELCGGLSELVGGVLAKDHPRLDMSTVRIVLLEAADRLLGGFGPKSADDALRALRERHVEVRLGAAVSSVSRDCVVLGTGERIEAKTTVWTAGVRANPIGSVLGLPVDRSGRVPVDEHLRAPDLPDVFVIGDLAAAQGSDGRPYAQLAPVAMQEGRHVAAMLSSQIGNRPPPRAFRYFDKGTMATIGRNDAVAELPFGIRIHGFIAWVAWLGLHLLYLIGFRNRATVLLDWTWSYLTYQRSARLIGPMVDDPSFSPSPEQPPAPRIE